MYRHRSPFAVRRLRRTLCVVNGVLVFGFLYLSSQLTGLHPVLDVFLTLAGLPGIASLPPSLRGAVAP